jgi:hypothetical protein
MNYEQNNLSVHTGGISIDSDEENKSRLLKYHEISKKDPSFHHYPYFDAFIPPTSNEFKQEI